MKYLFVSNLMVLAVFCSNSAMAQSKTEESGELKFKIICDNFENQAAYAANNVNIEIKKLKGVQSVNIVLSPNSVAISQNFPDKYSKGQLCATVSYTGK